MNVKYVIAKSVSISFMLGAAAGSFHGEVALSHDLGLTWEAYTVPFLIDGMAVLGLLGRGREFARSTQRAGLVIAIAMGTLSLACNILAGHNLGQRLYGALIVGVFLASEWYATKLDKAPPAQPVVDTELAAKRSAAAVKAAATRKRNKAQAARKPRAPKPAKVIADLEQSYAMASAPVSPAA